jgi:Uma2 family endonuclease
MSVAEVPMPVAQEQRVILENVTWEIYEALLAANIDRSSPRMAYDKGTLEIMSPSRKHERLKERLAMVAQLTAQEWDLEFEALGSTTYRRRDIEKGVEPDACFYIQSVEQLRGEGDIDLTRDPPPDLVIEIEVTSPPLSKFGIYASLGVPEIWTSDGAGARILRLVQGHYLSQENSAALAPLDGHVLTEFVKLRNELSMRNWRKAVSEWARKHRP